jgi:hypothetical protein
VDALTPGTISPTRTFLILLGPLFLLWGLSSILEREPTEPWLAECSSNLDIIVAAQGERLARGDEYLDCSGWPNTAPREPTLWESEEYRCCGSCRGTWESLCNLSEADSPIAAQQCWNRCADRHMNGSATEKGMDWPNLCCVECGAERTARCTVSSDRNSEEVAACFSTCSEATSSPPPDACWWKLGFEPGVLLRGRYEVVLNETGFEAKCTILRENGEPVEFIQEGKRADRI